MYSKRNCYIEVEALHLFSQNMASFFSIEIVFKNLVFSLLYIWDYLFYSYQ